MLAIFGYLNSTQYKIKGGSQPPPQQNENFTNFLICGQLLGCFCHSCLVVVQCRSPTVADCIASVATSLLPRPALSYYSGYGLVYNDVETLNNIYWKVVIILGVYGSKRNRSYILLPKTRVFILPTIFNGIYK